VYILYVMPSSDLKIEGVRGKE
jgi:hypothetical protein